MDKFLFTMKEKMPEDANDPSGNILNLYSHHETNISDGAEFIDDNIRMKPQPYLYDHSQEHEWSGIIIP